MAKVYVSSTFLDLKDCRSKVNLALRKIGHEDVAMEYYVAGSERPVERCLADVANCDLYVGLFAWRYGYIPGKSNPEGLSITEMEYRQAQKLGKPCLIFLLSEDAPWPRKFMDKNAEQIERLRAELSAEHMTGAFTSAEDVTEAVYPAVYRWSEKHGHLPRRVSISELDLTAYFNALTRRYQHLDLDALTPPQRDENLRQRLREIFVEQNVRENPPPVELPKEVWEKLQRDREIHPEDLPAGITPEDVLRARESYFEKSSRPVLEAFTDPAHRRSVVLGDPGSGKSTLARYVLLSLVGVEGNEKLRRAFEGHLPLLIELRSYAGLCSEAKESTFLDFIEFISDGEGWGLDRKALEHYLKTDGRAVVVFDGLDEIFDPEDRESAARRIAGFAALYPKARILVTSRVIGYRRKVLTDAEFSHFTLQDLDERQVAQFIDRWYALALDERPNEARARRERIMRSFKASPSIRQLAGNPMLLTIMAIIGKNQELPRERWKLYDHAASVLIYHWDVERHLRDHSINAPFIGEEEKKELLRRLAFKMQSGEGGLAGNYVHRDDLQREFETYLRERFAQSPADATTIARAMIDQFRERNFILSLHGANLYGFVHRAFLEFFCASAFVQKFEKTQEMTLEEIKRDVYGVHWQDRSWHEVLRLICGMLDEKKAGDIINYLSMETLYPLTAYSEENPPWNIVLTVMCLTEVRKLHTIGECAQELLRRVCILFDTAMSMFKLDKFIREFLIPPIHMVGEDWPGRDLLAEWLNKRDSYRFSWGYAQEFSEFLGTVGRGLEKVHESILAYSTHEDASYRALAPRALVVGWGGDPRTKPLLVTLATSDPDKYVRAPAIRDLSTNYAADLAVLSLLKACAKSDNDELVRSQAIYELGGFVKHDEQVFMIFQDRAFNDGNETVRNWVAKTLNRQMRDEERALNIIRKLADSDPSVLVREEANKILNTPTDDQ